MSDSDSNNAPGPVLDFTFAEPRWQESLPNAGEICRRAALAAVEAGACGWDGPPVERLEISLVLSSDTEVQALNRGYRGQDKPTNVLSFAALDDEDAPLPDDGPVLLGDIIIAYETTQAEARAEGKSLQDHLSHLVVHGILHLMGFDHEEEDEAEAMEETECRVLAGLGIASPYDEKVSGDE